MRQQTFGGIMLAIATVVWGTALVAQRMGSDSVGPFTFNAVRFGIGAVVLLPLLLCKKPRAHGGSHTDGAPSDSRTLLRGGLLCGGLLFLNASLQQTAIAHTTVGKAGFITSLYILIVPLLSWLRGRQLAPVTWGCVAAAAIGLYLLCMDESLTLGFGDTLVLLCAFTTSLHILAIGHFAAKADAIRLSVLQFLVCGMLSLPAALLLETITLPALRSAAVPILYTGVLSCGIAYTLQTVGQKTVSPVAAVLILSLESVFSVLSGWLVLGETLNAKEIAGCAILFAAVLLSQFAALRQERAGAGFIQI